jgi:transposase
MAAVAPADLVFLDETATPTTLTPLRARAPRGQRAVGRVPRGRRTHVSWLAALTLAGIGPSVLVEGAVDRDAFDAFVIQLLVPALRPGQVVVLDNLSVHKSAAARRAIEAAGCRVVFLPTYSPDFNPIELAFAKTTAATERAEARRSACLVLAKANSIGLKSGE